MSVSHLHPVADSQPAASESPIPDFEGQEVDMALVKLSAVCALDVSDEWSRIDDVVRMFVEGRVVRVDHIVDKAGRLCRVSTIKVLDAVQMPWDFELPVSAQ